MKFVFYDTETTGTNTTFDQILQFAAILTDDDLNEIDRFEVRCRLHPHVVPSPDALLVTKTRPVVLDDPELPTHYEMTRLIAEKLRAWSPAVFIGYNSLAFDEVLLRQAFYQTLQPTYLTNTSGNTRADVYRLVQAVGVYAPDRIRIPLTDDGKQSRRLDAVAPANGFNHDSAHDALGDVEATIFVAKLINERAPEIWDLLIPLASKTAVVERALSGELLSLTDFYYGRPYSWPVVGCGQNPDYSAQIGVFDLQYDPDDYIDMAVDELVGVMNGSKKAVRCIKGNNQPILIPSSTSGIVTPDSKIDAVEIERRARVVVGATEFNRRVGEALSNRYPPREPPTYLEERIYEGFVGEADSQRMERYHEVPWGRRRELLEGIADDRARELGSRLIFLEHPEFVPPGMQMEFAEWRRQRLSAPLGSAPWRSHADAAQEVEALRADRRGEDDDLLLEVKAWMEAREGSLGVDSERSVSTNITHDNSVREPGRIGQ